MRNKVLTLLLAAFIALGAFVLPTMIDGGVDTVMACSGNPGGGAESSHARIVIPSTCPLWQVFFDWFKLPVDFAYFVSYN
ncbi:MAG: hypothetical protein AAF702_37010 [Chloroflexota bacterium]